MSWVMKRMEKPVTVTLTSGDWDWITALMKAERDRALNTDQNVYADNINCCCKKIRDAQEKAGAD